jgi:hypothetical protein
MGTFGDTRINRIAGHQIDPSTTTDESLIKPLVQSLLWFPWKKRIAAGCG